MPPKNQRRSHTKSKNGCSQCKIRRIKCNEAHPICSNCERRQITCDFSLSPADSGLAGSSDAPSSTKSPNQSQSSCSKRGSAAPSTLAVDPFLSPNLVSTKKTTELDVSDLELMHHWTRVVAPGLGDNGLGPPLTDIFQLHIPRLAFKYEFLLRGLLSVSALHLSYLNPILKAEYDLKASTHQDKALASFQEVLPLVDESNCHALFAFSCLLLPIAFATSSRDLASQEPRTDLFDWIYLLRGGHSILLLRREAIKNGVFEPMLVNMSYNEVSDPFVFTDAKRIADLFKLCHQMDDEEMSQACTLAVHTLLSTFIQAAQLRKRGEGFVIPSLVWPVHLSPKFLDLLSERKAEALIILAHYCVLMDWGAHADTWFLEGWARYMLDAIKDSLSEERRPMVAWPDSVIRY